MDDTIHQVDYLCVWAWKRRGGWAGSGGVMGSLLRSSGLNQWEYRSIVVVGHMLRYYEMGTEDADMPRGEMDLWQQHAKFQIVVPDKDEGAPTLHQIIIHANSPTQKKKDQGRDDNDDDAIEWQLCFDQQDDLIRLVSVLNSVLVQGGAFQPKDVDRFEHDFNKGDHIYRWELIVCPPVIYPIQIHAIVLEAGRNCLVVADFGLTGYAKKKDAHFHHAEDNDEAMQQQILAAFRKLRPTDATQRLNIVTLTDQREIRKWFKAGYDEESMLAKVKASAGHGQHAVGLDRVGKIFHRNSPGKRNSNENSPTKEYWSFYRTKPSVESDQQQQQPPFVPLEQGTDWVDKDVPSSSETTGGGGQTLEKRKQQQQQQLQQLEKLPHSDPVEIVLARANFCLENMGLLPPYHVFFSNSECIAVWCKTGRWSTLQTAVWCSTNSIGALKTSTLTTIGVAAANPLLAPVIAIGGLLWVSAPLLFCKNLVWLGKNTPKQ